MNTTSSQIHYEWRRYSLLVLIPVFVAINGVVYVLQGFPASSFLCVATSPLVAVLGIVLVLWLDRMHFASVEIRPDSLVYRARGNSATIPWSDIEAIQPIGTSEDIIRFRVPVRMNNGTEVIALPMRGFGPWRRQSLGRAIAGIRPDLVSAV